MSDADPIDLDLDLDALRTLRRRAYEELATAIDQGGPQLSGVWFAERDPDLESLRTLGDPEWQLLVRRHTGERRPEDPSLPEPASADPHRRRNEWRALTALGLVVAVAVLFRFPSWVLLSVVLLVGVGLALVVTHFERKAKAAKVRAVAARARRAKAAPHHEPQGEGQRLG